MKYSKELITIFLIQITEVLGFSLILPFLPFYIQDLGGTVFQVGLIFSIFSVFQFISAPIMGKLSDHYGRRPLLILSQLSTMTGFIVLGLSNTLWLVVLARIIDGLLGSNFTIAQAYLSDISTKENRSKMFGISGVAFGIGFLIGPGIGGYLSQFGYGIPSFVAAGISLLTILLTYFFLPETVEPDHEFQLDLKVVDVELFSRYLKSDEVGPKLWQFFLYLMTHTLWVSNFAIFAERKVGLEASDVGLLLTYIGLISIILRGGLLPKLIDWLTEFKLQLLGVASVILAMLITIFIVEVWQLYLALTFFAFGSGVSRPVMQGEISRSVSDKEQGQVMGITGSLGSISQIVAPLVGGYILQQYTPVLLSTIAAILMSGILLIMARKSTRLQALLRIG